MGQLFGMIPDIANTHNLSALSASLHVNESCYPMASSHIVQILLFCDGVVDMPSSLLSEDAHRNPYAENLMGDTARLVWGWIS